MLTENTLETLRSLKLHGMVQALEHQRETPDTHALAFEERFGLLVDRERLYRQNGRYRGLLREARLKVVKRIVRCAAINVDPETAVRDLEIPAALMRRLGHADCGIYAEVIEGGTIGVDDAVATEAPRLVCVNQKQAAGVGRHPHPAGKIFMYQPDHRRICYAQLRLHRGDLCIIDDIEPNFGAHPNAAPAIFVDGLDRIAGQAIVTVECGDVIAIARVDSSAIRPDPQDAIAIFEQRAHAYGLKAVRRRHMAKGTPGVHAHACVGTDPNAAGRARRDAPGFIALQTFRYTQRHELAIAQAQQPVVGTADPEASLIVLVQCTEIFADHVISISRAENPISQPHQPKTVGGDPKIAITIARERAHGRTELPGRRHEVEVSAGFPVQFPRFGAEPQGSIMILVHRRYEIHSSAGVERH